MLGEAIFKKVILLVNTIIPKKRNLWVFVSIPDYSDNAKALFEYVSQEHPEIEKVWLCYDPAYAEKLRRRGIKAYSHFSFKGIWTFLRARVIITTHNDYLSMKSRHQCFVSLWHGIGIKASGFKDDREKNLINESDMEKIDIMTVDSEFIRHLVVSMFHVPRCRVYVTGQARNDKLMAFKSKNECITLLSKVLDYPFDKNTIFILYAPTYRKSFKREDSEDPIYLDAILNNDELTDVLRKFNAVLLIKLHPLEEMVLEEVLLSKLTSKNLMPSRIFLLPTAKLRNLMLDTNDLLPCMDALITDYSSIYIDYLLLDRPMVFYPFDLNTYLKYRPLLFYPYSKWTPGPKAYSEEELAYLIWELLSGENPKLFRKYRCIQNILKKVFYAHIDDKCRARIVALIKNCTKD